MRAKHSIRSGSGRRLAPTAAAEATATAVGTSASRPCAMTERTARWGSRAAASTSVITGIPSGPTTIDRHIESPPRSIDLDAHRAVAESGVTTSTTNGQRSLARALIAYIGQTPRAATTNLFFGPIVGRIAARGDSGRFAEGSQEGPMRCFDARVPWMRGSTGVRIEISYDGNSAGSTHRICDVAPTPSSNDHTRHSASAGE